MILSKVVIKFESYDRSLLAEHTTDRRRVARSMGRRQRTRWALNCEKRMDRYYIARPNVIPRLTDRSRGGSRNGTDQSGIVALCSSRAAAERKLNNGFPLPPAISWVDCHSRDRVTLVADPQRSAVYMPTP